MTTFVRVAAFASAMAGASATCMSNGQLKDDSCCNACGDPVYSQGDTMLDGSTCNDVTCDNTAWNSCIEACPNTNSAAVPALCGAAVAFTLLY